ncbi:MAG: hypothetical protein LUO98_01065, partial [Methanoregula sp.]|nr:hypothetical protein [Methanoregula sp.]
MMRVIRPEAGECRISSEMWQETNRFLLQNKVLRPNASAFFDPINPLRRTLTSSSYPRGSDESDTFVRRLRLRRASDSSNHSEAKRGVSCHGKNGFYQGFFLLPVKT